MLKELHFRAAFFLSSVFAVFMALTPQPPRLPIDSFGDKFEHILAFGVLTIFARLGFGQARNRIILGRMSFLGAMIELFQAIPVLHRDCDWRDWMADTLAAAVVLLVMQTLAQRKLAASKAK